MSDRPYPGESLSDFRARRSRELDDQAKGVGSGPSADDQVEAAKAKVRADNAAKARARVSDPKNAVNKMDAAADTDDQVKAVHKQLAGGVKPVDKKAADAAFAADKSFQGKSSEEQAAVAKGAKPARASAPAATPTPASKASEPAVKPAQERRITITPDAATSARNNMGVPRGGDRGSAVAGVASSEPKSDLEAARAAATKGSRNPSKRQAEDKAAMASSRRSAASAAPVAPARSAPAQQPQGVFSGSRMAQAHAAALGFSGPSSKVSDKPKTVGDKTVRPDYRTSVTGTPAPATPATVAASPQFGSGIDQIRAAGKGNDLPVTRAGSSMGAPKAGTDVIHGVKAERGPVANTRNNYRGHIAEGGNNESYWADRDSKKAAGPKAKPAKAAPVASVEPLSGTAAIKDHESRVDAQNITPKAPVPSAPAKAPAGATPLPPATHTHKMQPAQSAPQMPSAPAPSRTPTPQRTPMSSQMTGAPAPAPAGPPTPPKPPTRAAATPAPAGPSRPAPVAAPSVGTPVTPPTPVGGGRSGISAPRSPEVGGGRGGLHQGGEHNVNVGGDNYGNITHNHNTYNVNHGVNYGSMGNVDHGYAPRGGGGGGGGRASGGGHAPHEAHEVHNDLWIKDVNGTHSLHKGIQHVTGQTGGHGEKMPTTKPKAAAGGATQNPLKGSPRAAGSTPATPATGTGTTHNWQGPQTTHQQSASGNGTAQITTP